MRTHNFYARSYIASLMMIPALLVGSIAIPVNSQETTKVAQLLNPPTTRSQNAEVVTQNFLTLLAQQKYEQAAQYISPGVQGNSSTAQIQQLWQKLINATGPFVSISQINSAEILGRYTIMATVEFQDSTEDFLVKLDQNQKITEIDFLWLGGIQANAKHFVNALAKGEYIVARSYLSPDLKASFPPNVIGQRWENITTKLGSFKQLSSSTALKNSDYDVVQLNLEFEHNSGKFFIFFNPLGQIVGFDSPLKKQ